MPIWWPGVRKRVAPRCNKKYTWSTYRGGCRFDPNHTGPCKPVAGKR